MKPEDIIEIEILNWKQWCPPIREGHERRFFKFPVYSKRIDNLQGRELKLLIKILQMSCEVGAKQLQTSCKVLANLLQTSGKRMATNLTKLKDLGYITFTSLSLTIPITITIREEVEKHARSRTTRVEFDLEKIYENYPKKKGKRSGMARLSKQIKTQADYDAFALAVDRYRQEMQNTDKQFIKDFSTFVGPGAIQPWRDYLEVEAKKEGIEIG